MKIKDNVQKVEIPEGVSATVEGKELTIKGPKGEVKKTFIQPTIVFKVENNEIVFNIKKFTKVEKSLLGTYKAHIKNLAKGVTEGHEYVLKICSGHFPMNVSIKNNKFQVKNYLGEKIPRILQVNPDVEVKVDGDKVTITGINKETVSQTAASIEQLTRRSNFDRRVFQDGIYIVNKDGKEIK